MKKGLFFTMDAFIGLSILFMGIYFLSSSILAQPVTQPAFSLAEDILAILSKTHFADMNLSVMAPEIRLLVGLGKIDPEKTPLAQLGEFYFLWLSAFDDVKKAGLKKDMEYVVGALVGGMVPKNYGWEIYIEEEQVYKAVQGPPKENAKITLVKQQLSFGTYKKRHLFGPYVVRVVIWG